MSGPNQSSVHIDALLSNVSVATMQQAEGFVAGRVFPDIPVAKQSDKYAIIPAGDFNRDTMQKRADATESAGSGFGVSNDSYFADVWALHKDIGDQTRANADSAFQLNENTTKYLATQNLIRREKLFVATAMATSIWSTDQTGVSGTPSGAQFKQWNDAASDPVADVRSFKTSMQILTGYRPNVMVMGRQVFDELVEHADLKDRIKYGTQSGGSEMVSLVTRNIVAQLFELDEVLVMEAIENTAAEGQTASNAFIGGKTALLIYRTPTPGLGVPNAGYTFSWTGLLGSAGMGTRVSNFRMEQLKADRLEIESAFDMKVSAADLGVFMASVVA